MIALKAYLLSHLKSLLLSRAFIALIIALIICDLVFISLHVTHMATRIVDGLGWFRDHRFSLEVDNGFAERFEYGKTAACIVAMFGCWIRTRQPVYAAFAAALAFVLADNAFYVHETFGEVAKGAFAPAARAFQGAPQALGELAFYAVVGPAIFGLVAAAFQRTRADHRPFALAFVLVLLALGFFGVGVDLLHAAVRYLHPVVNAGFGFVEDGGELVILSLACALSLAAFATCEADRRARPHRRC